MEIPIELCDSCKAYRKDTVKRYFLLASLIALYSFSGEQSNIFKFFVNNLLKMVFLLKFHIAITLPENLEKLQF